MNIDSTTNCSASNQTDEINSIVSNSSGLSDYQDNDEFDLSSPQNYTLVDYTQSSTPKNDSGCDIQYEEPVDDPSHQLQNTLTSNQKYENDLYRLKKNIKMQYHIKLGTLIKDNSQLKFELTKANEQIERLLKQFSTISGNSNLDYYFIKLEKQNYDLISQNHLLEAKFSQIKTEKNEAELQLKQMGTELNQYKIDIDMKNAVLKELKNKIINQHAEITKMSKIVNSFSYMFDETNLELQHTKKTLEWYKQELYSFQGNKKTLLTDLSNCKKEMSLLKETISNLNMELENTKNKYENFQLKALRDKINLFTTLQKCEYPATSENEKHESIELPNGNNSPILKEYENNIQDLNNEISRINTFVEVQNTTLEKVTRENSDLMSRCITLQKLLEQKENTINSLELENKHKKMEIEILLNQEQQINNEYNKVKKELINLRTELVMSKQENEIIESTVKTIRNQVSVFKREHNALKEELSNKNKQISSLQSEKQELFMKNSWQICELQKINDRDALISSLKKDIELKEQDIQKYFHKIEDLEDAIKKQGISVSKVINEKQILTLENEKEIQRYEFVLQQYKELLLSSEKKVNELRKHYTVNTMHQKTDQFYSKISLIDSCENLDDDLKTLMKVKFPNTSDLSHLDVKFFEKGSHRATSINSSTSCNVQNTEQKLDNKLHCITERAKKLSKKIVECQKLLNNIFSAMQSKQSKAIAPCETIDDLRVLLQVKNLEMEEKRKKYDKSNRLLLRKVREHMKAQTLAEKHNEQLEQWVKLLADENSLLKSSVENQISNTEKLKKSEFKLEDKPEPGSPCQNECLEYQEKLKTPERIVLINSDKTQLCETVEYEHIIEKPQKEVHNLILENTWLISNNNIQESSSEFMSEIKRLEEKLSDENPSMSELMKSFEENSMKELSDKIEILSNENQILRFSLQKKTEEFGNLEREMIKKQIDFEKSTLDSHDLINEMKNHVNEIQSDRESTDSEKFFLQRICNDLKLSLKSQTNYSKILEEKLSHFSQRPNNFSSLPNILSSLPNIHSDSGFKMYDVQCVNHLLQYKIPVQEIELTEVRGCLDSLRKEIFTLQEQIKKNYNAE